MEPEIKQLLQQNQDLDCPVPTEKNQQQSSSLVQISTQNPSIQQNTQNTQNFPKSQKALLKDQINQSLNEYYEKYHRNPLIPPPTQNQQQLNNPQQQQQQTQISYSWIQFDQEDTDVCFMEEFMTINPSMTPLQMVQLDIAELINQDETTTNNTNLNLQQSDLTLVANNIKMRLLKYGDLALKNTIAKHTQGKDQNFYDTSDPFIDDEQCDKDLKCLAICHSDYDDYFGFFDGNLDFFQQSDIYKQRLKDIDQYRSTKDVEKLIQQKQQKSKERKKLKKQQQKQQNQNNAGGSGNCNQQQGNNQQSQQQQLGKLSKQKKNSMCELNTQNNNNTIKSNQKLCNIFSSQDSYDCFLDNYNNNDDQFNNNNKSFLQKDKYNKANQKNGNTKATKKQPQQNNKQKQNLLNYTNKNEENSEPEQAEAENNQEHTQRSQSERVIAVNAKTHNQQQQQQQQQQSKDDNAEKKKNKIILKVKRKSQKETTNNEESKITNKKNSDISNKNYVRKRDDLHQQQLCNGSSYIQFEDNNVDEGKRSKRKLTKRDSSISPKDDFISLK